MKIGSAAFPSPIMPHLFDTALAYSRRFARKRVTDHGRRRDVDVNADVNVDADGEGYCV